MALHKTLKGWQVDIQPGGRTAKRYRKTFKTKSEALRWQNWMQHQTNQDATWNPPQTDSRTLQQLADTWYQIHGKNLADHKRRKAALDAMIQAMGNPKAKDFTAAHFVDYRTEKLNTATANTVNHHHAYLRAVFAELIRSGHWQDENPLSKLRRLKIKEQELSYLTQDQIKFLLDQLQNSRNQYVYWCVVLALATGARWSEVQTLRTEHLATDSVTFIHTKNGKNRTVPVSAELIAQIPKPTHGRLFKECYGAFKKALQRSSIELPQGQKAHVLRHTFASHFMQQGGNIIVLQRILGHQSLVMTMRYAHFSPDHLSQAKYLNPMRDFL